MTLLLHVIVIVIDYAKTIYGHKGSKKE